MFVYLSCLKSLHHKVLAGCTADPIAKSGSSCFQPNLLPAQDVGFASSNAMQFQSADWICGVSSPVSNMSDMAADSPMMSVFA